MALHRPNFDNTISLSLIVQIVLAVAAGITIYGVQIRWQTTVDTQIATVLKSMDRTQDIVVPIVQANTSINALQDERIKQQGKVLDDLLTTNKLILANMTTIREDIATLKARGNVK